MHPSRWQPSILAAVREEGRLTIAALAERLNVSDETIRRHVKPLVAEGVLWREHGAVVARDVPLEPPFSRRMKEAAEAKRAIALAAAARVHDGQTVMIDTGSTTAHVAAALGARRDLTVVTNSIEIARRLVGRDGHRVFMAGGELRADIAAAVGPEALAFIDRFRADLAIISIGGIDAEYGFMDFDLAEAGVAQAMLARSAEAMVVADTRKFGARALVRVCGFDDVACVVTEDAPPADARAKLAAAGASLVVAQPLLAAAE
jgi:DeoR family transcriptional regulator, glycerol-3-phosphate regulon repressor